MKTSRYEVKPHSYTPPKIALVTASERAQAAYIAGRNLGCGTLFVGGVLFIVGINTIPTFTIIATFAFPLSYYLIRRISATIRLARQRIRAERERIKSERASVESEARSLTATLINLHDSAPTHVQSLGHYIRSAEADLDTAEHDYSDGAFAPFWDAIECAANNLSCFDTTTRQLTDQARQYYTWLRDRNHTFPHFPVALTTLPDPSHTTNRMQAIVRKAQCNFQFATIYEQRKTNNILKHGFMSLSSALSDLGYTVRSSMDELRESVSSDIAHLVDEQIATRDSIDSAAAVARTTSEDMLSEIRSGNKAAASRSKQQQEQGEAAAEMLDNIQRRRKPYPRKPGDGAY